MSEQLQVNIHGPDDVRLDRVDVPEPGPRDAVVKVAACGICGSDLGYARLGGLMGPTGSPMPIGHELAGVVEFVGAEVTGVEVGARVVVDPQGAENQIGNGGSEGAFTPRLLVRNAAEGDCLIPIPSELSFEMAALAEPLGVGMRSVDQSRAQAGERAVVFGAGPIGLSAVATLRFRGVENIVAVDYSDARLAVAERLGAAACLNPARDDVGARLRELHGTSRLMGAPMAGSDLYIEASGAAPVLPQIIAGAKRGARIVVVALHREAIAVNFLVVMMKELELRGSIAQPDDWNDMLTMLGEFDLSPMISHRFDLESFPAALAMAQDPDAGVKVMGDCWAGDP